MNGIYNNILETIGNTPIVKLNKLAPKDVNVFVKIESFNPMGSVKDRLPGRKSRAHTCGTQGQRHGSQS